MKQILTACIVIPLVCSAVVSCQSPGSVPSKVAKKTITKEAPLPAWTRAKGDGGVVDGRQIKFATKFIEVTRQEGEDLPKSRYRKKMSDREFQAFIRKMAQRKGADMMTSPVIVTPEGRSAHSQVGREFVHPQKRGSSVMKTEFVGVSNFVRARRAKDGKRIKIDVLAQVTNFEGFQEGADGSPVFSTRRAESDGIELASGESIVLGGLMTKEEQEVEDRIPVLGDIPLLGGAFTNRSTHTFHKELIVIVTPTVVTKASGSSLIRN